MNTHEIAKPQYEAQTEDHRTPVRKPMSVVQYWVNTGNLFPTENSENNIHSDSGSSLAEEECTKSVHALNFSCPFLNSSLEKIVKDDQVSNKHSADNSCSSVDTAAYILANNNTTKKSDTLAIVEGSKATNKRQSCDSHVPQDINIKVDDNANLTGTDDSLKEIIDENLISDKVNNLKLIVSSESDESRGDENRKNINRGENEISSRRFIPNDMYERSICSESDESILKTTYNADSQRKKLYNSSESPVEFTPVSEDNYSHKFLRKSFKNSYGHPALETPVRPKPLSFIITQRLKRKYPIQRSSQSTVLSKVIEDDKGNDEAETQINNDKIESQKRSQNKTENLENLEKNFIISNRYIGTSDTETIILPSNKQEKSIKHENSLSDIETIKWHNSPIKFRKSNNNNKKARSSEFSNNEDDFTNNLLQNSIRNKTSYTNKLIEVESDKTTEIYCGTDKIINEFISNENESKGIQTCLKNKVDDISKETSDFIETPSNNSKSVLLIEKSSVEGLKNKKDKKNIVKYLKYTLILSSSDESELNLDIPQKRSRKKLSRVEVNKISSNMNENSSKKSIESIIDNQSESRSKNSKFSDNEKVVSRLNKRKVEKISKLITLDQETNNMIENESTIKNLSQNESAINKEFSISKKTNKRSLILSSDDDASMHSPEKLSKVEQNVFLKNITGETRRFNESKVCEIPAENNHMEKEADNNSINKESKTCQTVTKNGHVNKNTKSLLANKSVESDNKTELQLFDTSSSEDDLHQSHNTKTNLANKKSNKNKFNNKNLSSENEDSRSVMRTTKTNNFDINSANSIISHSIQTSILQSSETSNEKYSQLSFDKNRNSQNIISNESIKKKSNDNNQLESCNQKEIEKMIDNQFSDEDLISPIEKNEKFHSLRKRIEKMRMKVNSACSRIKDSENCNDKPCKVFEKRKSTVQSLEFHEKILNQSQNITSPKGERKEKHEGNTKFRLSNKYLHRSKLSNKRSTPRYNQSTTKENKYSLRKFKRKSFNISSDEDCIIPIK